MKSLLILLILVFSKITFATELNEFTGNFSRIDVQISKTQTLCREHITLRQAISRANQLWISSFDSHNIEFQTYISLEKTNFYFTETQIAKIIGNSLIQTVYHDDSQIESYELKLTIYQIENKRRLNIEFTDKDTGIVETNCTFAQD